MSESALKMVYHSLFHSVLSYGVICWGNSSQSITIYKIEEKVIRVMLWCRNRNSCKNVFKILNILPLKSQYIFSFLTFVVNNQNYLTTNADNYIILNRKRNNLHLPQANIAIFWKGAYYSGIKIFNTLPTEIKDLSDNPKKFKIALKHFLYSHSS